MTAKVYTITSLANETGMSQVYIRKAVREGALKSTLKPISEDSKILRHEITEEAYLDWRMSTASRSRRDDGRNKFTLYATEAELEAILTAINASPIEDYDTAELIFRANQKKAQ